MKGWIIVFVALYFSIACGAEGLTVSKNDKAKDKVKFYVYTRFNPEKPEFLQADVESVVRNIINPAKPTTLAIHGMDGDKNANEYRVIKDTKLIYEDGNIITVDYSALNVTGDYDSAFTATPTIAEACSDLIFILHRYFVMDLQNLHVVGFSLGAQIAGLVGKNVFENFNEKLKRITALDPSGSLFNDSTPTNLRLTRDDAEFVEVVHTNAGVLGYASPCGHVDYYPNGGEVQPGCSVSSAGCSHIRAFELIPDMWLPKENHELLILKCSSAEYLGLDNCRWLNKKMGDPQEFQTKEGIYYVETNSQQPFGKGAFKSQFL